MEDLIGIVANWFGVEPAVILALLPTIVFLFNLISRLIPDDSTGFMGFLNKVFKVLGLYFSNRVSKGVSVNDVTKVVVGADVPARAPNGQFTNVGEILDRVDQLRQIKQRSKEDGFISGFLLSFKSMFLFALVCGIFVLLSGCTTLAAAKEISCSNRETIREAANLTLLAVDKLDQVCPIPLLPKEN